MQEILLKIRYFERLSKSLINSHLQFFLPIQPLFKGHNYEKWGMELVT